MKHRIVVIGAFLAIAVSATTPAFACGGCDDPIASLSSLVKNTNTNKQAQGQAQGQMQGQQQGQVLDSTNLSSSYSGASAGSTAITGPSTAVTGPATSIADVSGAGSNNGATVSTTNDVDARMFVPVQVAELPQTIAVGSIRLEKVGSCGRRYEIEPFKRDSKTPVAFGGWNSSSPVETMHGVLKGFDKEHPFIVDEVVLPAPFNKKIVTIYGHQLYLTVGTDGQGGGSSGAANYAAEKAMGLGMSLSANGSFGVIGAVAVPCVFDPSTALKTAKIDTVVKTEKQGLVLKEAVRKRDAKAGEKYKYWDKGDVEKTETHTSQEVPVLK